MNRKEKYLIDIEKKLKSYYFINDILKKSSRNPKKSVNHFHGNISEI